MKVAYLVNRYPAPSHTFIRREIAALEALGLEVGRFSIRGDAPLVDLADLEERRRTRSILEAGPMELLGASIAAALLRPLKLARALALVVRLGWRSDRGLLRHLVYLVEACLLSRWLRASGAEHLHAHFGTNPAAVAAMCHALGGPPFSFTVHGPEEFDRPEALRLGDKCREARFVVAISEFGRSQLYRWCHIEDWQKIHVVRCGVDAGFLRAGRVPVPAAPRIVTIGRLSEQKGHAVLLEALAMLHRGHIEFEAVLVGDGPLRLPLERLARSLGIDGRVRFLGTVDGPRIIKEVQEARALVLPSFAEGLPVVIMEALALGRPVVATYVAAIPELVVPGVSGWLVPQDHRWRLARPFAPSCPRVRRGWTPWAPRAPRGWLRLTILPRRRAGSLASFARAHTVLHADPTARACLAASTSHIVDVMTAAAPMLKSKGRPAPRSSWPIVSPAADVAAMSPVAIAS